MKRTNILAAATLTAALATLASCNPSGSQEVTDTMPHTVTEVHSDGKTYVTKITYQPNSFVPDRAVTTLNGATVYEKSRYTTSLPQTYVLTNWEEDGGKTYKKVETHQGWTGLVYYIAKEAVYAITSETDTGKGTLLESVENKFTDNTAYLSETIRKQGDKVVLRDYDFDYTNIRNSSNPYYTYTRVENDGTPVKMCYYVTEVEYDTYNNPIAREYAIYKGWVDTDNKGLLVESRTDVSTSNLTIKFTMKYYDEATGTLRSVATTEEHVSMTVIY